MNSQNNENSENGYNIKYPELNLLTKLMLLRAIKQTLDKGGNVLLHRYMHTKKKCTYIYVCI